MVVNSKQFVDWEEEPDDEEDDDEYEGLGVVTIEELETQEKPED